MTLTVGSLFSGIGGLDLGLERAGMRVIWQSEIDPYASRVLARHWPDIPNLGDIKTIDWSTVERPDLICGGYPCQPFSYAGARKGATDARHLWPWFADAIRRLRPDHVLLENVPGHLSMGFGDVLADLAELGFDAEWDCIPAAAVGAPHLRYRVFVVATAAHTDSESEPVITVDGPLAGDVVPDAGRDGLRDEPVPVAGCGSAAVAPVDGSARPVVDADGKGILGRGLQQSSGGEESWDVADTDDARRSERRGTIAVQAEHVAVERGGQTVADAKSVDDFLTTHHGIDRRSDETKQSRVGGQTRERGDTDGSIWTVEPNVGRVAHGVPHRVDRLRCLGNAVVPQVAEWVGRRILGAV